MEDCPAPEGAPVTRFERVDAGVFANGRAHWYMVRPPLEPRPAVPKAPA